MNNPDAKTVRKRTKGSRRVRRRCEPDSTRSCWERIGRGGGPPVAGKTGRRDGGEREVAGTHRESPSSRDATFEPYRLCGWRNVARICHTAPAFNRNSTRYGASKGAHHCLAREAPASLPTTPRPLPGRDTSQHFLGGPGLPVRPPFGLPVAHSVPLSYICKSGGWRRGQARSGDPHHCRRAVASVERRWVPVLVEVSHCLYRGGPAAFRVRRLRPHLEAGGDAPPVARARCRRGCRATPQGRCPCTNPVVCAVETRHAFLRPTPVGRVGDTRLHTVQLRVSPRFGRRTAVGRRGRVHSGSAHVAFKRAAQSRAASFRQ